MSELPEGWTEAPISDLVELQENEKPFQQGWSPQCEGRPADADEWAVVKTTAIQHGEFWAHENKALPATLEPRPQIEITAGDVLMTCAGPRNRCGVACLVRSTRGRLMMSGKMYRFRPHPDLLDPQFLSRFIGLHRTQVRIDEMKTGINDSGLNLTHSRFGKLQVVLPPLNEQRRIVERIEARFAEIDKGIESLQAARTALGLYRQSLLKSAFEGRLTADWRAANPDKLETPDALLARIKGEREAGYKVALTEWKTACAAWEEDGRRGPKPKKPEKLEPPTPLATHEMASIPELPDEWVYCRLSDVAAIGSGMSVSKSRKHEDPMEVSYLRVANVQRGYLDLSDIRSMPVERSQLASLKLQELDVLFNEGGDRDKLGRGWVWDGQIETCITQNHVFRARPYKQERTWSRFISEWGNSYGRDYFEKGGKQTTNLASINKTVLKALPVPLCAPAEQNEIVRILDERLSAADALGEEIEVGLKRADALRQSILTEAFAGRLVPQDPADEPAAVLLERIRVEQEAKPKGKRRRRPKKSEQTEELVL